MKYENISRAKTICDKISSIKNKIETLQKLKSDGNIEIHTENIRVKVFLGQEMCDWIINRAIVKYRGMLLELHAELDKL